MKKNVCFKSVVAIIYCCISIHCHAGSQSDFKINPEPDKWNFTIAPYGWLSSLSADVTVKNISDHFSIPVSKILKNLDFIGELHLEATKGRWSFMLDPTYVKLSADKKTGPMYVGPLNRFVIGPINVDLDSQILIIDTGVYYQTIALENRKHESLSLELFGGARYFGLKNQLSLAPRRSELFSGIKVTGKTNVIAPIIGTRFIKNYAKTRIWLVGNIGGFGIDNVTNTWGAVAGLSYNITQQTELGLAYRLLNIKVSKSTSSSFNALMHGPEVGIIFKC